MLFNNVWTEIYVYGFLVALVFFSVSQLRKRVTVTKFWFTPAVSVLALSLLWFITLTYVAIGTVIGWFRFHLAKG